MTERYEELGAISNDGIAEALGAHLHPAKDFTYGIGARLTVADGKADVEVYPAAGVARVTTDHARVEVHAVPGFSLDADKGRIVFEQGAETDRTRLIVRGDGKVSFYPVVQAIGHSISRETSQADGEPTNGVKRLADGATEPQKPASDSGQETEKDKQITMQGRLGRDPWFSTRDDSPIAGFPLAVNDENRTIWHRVVVFDETVMVLRDQWQKGDIRKGRLVDITGQPVTVQEETARGPKKITEFHASQVTRVRTSPPRSSPPTR